MTILKRGNLLSSSPRGLNENGRQLRRKSKFAQTAVGVNSYKFHKRWEGETILCCDHFFRGKKAQRVGYPK